jgi:hypothetical protein
MLLALFIFNSLMDNYDLSRDFRRDIGVQLAAEPGVLPLRHGLPFDAQLVAASAYRPVVAFLCEPTIRALDVMHAVFIGECKDPTETYPAGVIRLSVKPLLHQRHSHSKSWLG